MTEDKDRDVMDEQDAEASEDKPARSKPGRTARRVEARARIRDRRALEALGEERPLAEQLGMPAFFLGLLAILVGLGWWQIIHAVARPGPMACLGGGVLLLAYGIMFGLRSFAKQVHGRGWMVIGVAAALTFAVLLALVALNVLFVSRTVRVDLTKGRYQSLTQQSRDVIGKVKQDVDITVVIQGNALAFQSFDLDQVKRLLHEYEVVNDRVKWEVVDVYRNPAKARELNVSFPGKAIVKSGEKREEVTLAQDNEETLTSAIYRVTKPDKSVVYYLTGHGELTLEEFGSGQYQCGRLRKALNNIQMDVKPLTLKRTGEAPPPLPLKVEDATEASKQAVQDVPDDAKVVMVLGPKAPLAQSEIDALNRYLDEKQGGLFLALSGEKGAPDLSQILSRYEVKVEPGFVIDAYKYLDSPAIPGIDTFDSGSEIVQNLSVVALPLTRAFSIQEMPPEQNPYGQPPPTPSATALLKTSGEAWLETSELKEGVRIRKDSGEVSGAQTVAVVIDTKKQKPPTPPGMPEMPEPDEGPGVRLVAVGSSMMLTDNFASQVPGSNLDFVAQSVSWLSGGQALSIPEKKPPTLTINFSSAQRAIVAWTLVGVIPLGTILIGVFVWWRRR